MKPTVGSLVFWLSHTFSEQNREIHTYIYMLKYAINCSDYQLQTVMLNTDIWADKKASHQGDNSPSGNSSESHENDW